MNKMQARKAKNCEKKHCAAVALITVLMLLIAAAMLVTSVAVAETEPDYTFEETLPADGSNDTTSEYNITRANESKDGYIRVEAYIDEREVRIKLENIEKIAVYFDEMGINLEDYKTKLRLLSADISIVITSDTNTLDGEFHGVPNPDEVGVDTNWIDHSYSDGVFSFEGLETSTATITFSYDGLLGWDFAYELFTVLWYLLYVMLFVQAFQLLFDEVKFDE